MILQLKLEVQNESHQNEVLNRVEATGAKVLKYHTDANEIDLEALEKEYEAAMFGSIPPPVVICGDADPVIEVLKERGYIQGQTVDFKLPEFNEQMPDQPEMVAHMPFLEYLASHCSTIVEIGCGHGNGSTRAFERGMKRNLPCPATARTLSNRMVHVMVDIDQERPQVRPQACQVGINRYFPYYVTGDSRDASTRDEARNLAAVPVDMIYIDTEHTYEVMKAELKNWTPLISNETILVFHDTWMFGAYNHMTDAIREWALARGWEFNDFTKVSHGLGLLFHPKSEWANNRAMLEANYDRFYRDLEPK